MNKPDIRNIADELVEFCASYTTKSRIVAYWTAEIYSFGKYIREYGYYPTWLPLCIYTDHGPAYFHSGKPFNHELESDAPAQFFHSPESVSAWRNYSDKPCYVMYSPAVFYRKNNNIQQSLNAKGTIAFPAHTTESLDDVSDIELYARQLLELPEQFQPVSVCLHMSDIQKGQHKIFARNNIPVFTAGNSLDDRFAERFYDIIRNFRYATSNMVGSYLYYCVEMGLPFSIYGNRQSFINKADPNIVSGEYDPYKLFVSYRVAYEMFSGLNTGISKEQIKYAESNLGLYDGIGRVKMSAALYVSFIKWITSCAGWKYLTMSFIERMKKIFS